MAFGLYYTLHDIAIANIVYCMVYGIQHKGVRGGVVYMVYGYGAIVACNSKYYTLGSFNRETWS